MSNMTILWAVAVMAAATYLPRMIPLAVFRKKIKNRFLQSFLMYMPYGVLAAMVFPDVINSTASIVSAIAGTACALIMSYKNLGLMPVALGATGTVFVCEYLLSMVSML